MIKKYWRFIHIVLNYGETNSKKEVNRMFRFERVLDTVLGYTGWHDLTNTMIHSEQELRYLYDDEEDDDPLM